MEHSYPHQRGPKMPTLKIVQKAFEILDAQQVLCPFFFFLSFLFPDSKFSVV